MLAQSEVQPFVLGISTSAGIAQVCALALPPTPVVHWSQWPDVPIHFEFEITDYKQQSLELLPLLLDNMSRVGLVGEGCKAIACNIGPGGFTSLRTACGVAQGLATAWACGVLPVSSFECMAAEFALQGGDLGQPLACYMDARLQEFYAAMLAWTLIQSNSSGFEMLRNPCQIKAKGAEVQLFSESQPSLPVSPLKLIDQAACTILQGQSAGQASMDWQVVSPSARGLAVLGVLATQAGKLQEPFVLQPLYVREKVAQTTSERLAARDVGI